MNTDNKPPFIEVQIKRTSDAATPTPPAAPPPLRLLCGIPRYQPATKGTPTCDRHAGHGGYHHDSKKVESWPQEQEPLP